MADRPPFALFFGCGRSGTTMVQAMFDSHPDMHVVHEGRFIPQLAAQRERYERPEGLAVGALVDDLLANRNFRLHLQLDRAELEALLDPAPPTYADAVRRIYAAVAARAGKARVGDKTPAYVLHLPLLATLLPEARFVHVIRDGRSSTLSYLARERGPGDLAGNAFNWVQRVRAGRAAGAALGPSRYAEVRYEDLVADAEAALRPLCDLLELPFDPAMLTFHERAGEVTAGIRNPERFEHLHRPPTAGLRDWRTEMAPADLQQFEAIAGDLLDELGYERGAPPSGALRRRLLVARGWLSWQRQRLSFRRRARSRTARAADGAAR